MYRFKFFVIFFLFFVSEKYCAYSQTIKTENITVDNQKDQIIITYDISNPDEYTCQIDLTMKKKNDKTFRFQPKFVSGDIGEGDFDGKAKKIIWDKKRERLPVINIDDFIFEVNARVISTGNRTWLWVGAGAVLVGGGTALYFLLKKDNQETTPQIVNLPQPPGRP